LQQKEKKRPQPLPLCKGKRVFQGGMKKRRTERESLKAGETFSGETKKWTQSVWDQRIWLQTQGKRQREEVVVQPERQVPRRKKGERQSPKSHGGQENSVGPLRGIEFNTWGGLQRHPNGKTRLVSLGGGGGEHVWQGTTAPGRGMRSTLFDYEVARRKT